MSAAGRIRRAVAGVRAHLSRSLAVMVAAWCGTAALGLLVLAPALAGADGWSAGSPGPLVIALLIAAAVPAGIWSWRRLDRHWCAEHRVTRAMDRVGGLDEGSTLGGLELSRAAPAGTSPGLRDLALQQVESRLGGGSRVLAGGLGRRVERRVRRSVIAFLSALPAALAVLAAAPSRTFSAWDGLLHPLAVLVAPALPPVSVEPGTIEVARGAVVEVLARAPLRDSVTLRWDVTGQVARARTVALADGVGRSSLPAVNAETRYRIEAPDGARSDVHLLTPVDPLFVNNFTIEVTHPPHTGLPPGEYRDEIPPLAIPAGTHLRVRGRGSRAVGAGTLLDDRGRAVLELGVRDVRFEGSWIPSRSGTYTWRFSDAAGGEAAVSPGPLTLEVVPDLPPEVAIVHPGVDTIMPVDLRQPLVIRAADDYGIGRVEIVARRITAFGEAGRPVVHRVELGGSAGAIVRPVLDASAWTLSPGDTIRYLARAVDNNPSPRASESTGYVLWIGGATELGRAAEEELSRTAAGLQELAGEARRAAEETRDLRVRGEGGRRGGTRGGQARFEDREEIARAGERQEGMIAALDSLQGELAALNDALRDAGLADPQLRERLGELEKLLDGAAPQEVRERLETLRKRLAAMDPEELRQALERMAEEQERLRQRLEDALERFRSAVLEQDFRATGEEARALAEEQEILARAMGEGGDEPLRAAQQAGLEAEAEELQQQLEALRQRLDQAGEERASTAVQQAGQQLSQARRQMRQAARMAGQGRQRNAADRAEQAAGDLSQLAQQLDGARMQMQMRQMEAVRTALSQTAADALALARRQGELRGEMLGAGARELAALRADEAAIARGIRNLAENYGEGTGMAAPGARDLITGIGRAMEELDATIAAMENPRARGRPSPEAAAGRVIRSLNEVARMAMASGEQGQAQGAASATEQMMQQLRQLAGQQGEIMEDAASLTPMRLGRETLRERTEEVAGRQEKVAEELDEMSQAEEQGGDPLGDLSAFAEEAREVAAALARGRLDPEVLSRQERLFHRLLDAGRTLEREEESKERAAERPGTFTREGVEALAARDLDVLRFEFPGPAALRALPPAQRALVIRYFERLNRSLGGGAGSGGGR